MMGRVIVFVCGLRHGYGKEGSQDNR